MNTGQPQTPFRRLMVGEHALIVPLYVDDAQLAEFVLGGKARLWSTVVRQLEGEGLPRQKQLFGSMRYLPAVVSFFNRREGLHVATAATMAEDGPEYFGP